MIMVKSVYMLPNLAVSIVGNGNDKLLKVLNC